MSDFYDRVIAQLEKTYPESAKRIRLRERLSPLLFCPDVLVLPVAVQHQAEKIVRAFFELRSVSARSAALAALTPALPDPGNTSALMSYDFHLASDGRLRLIEINTNASLSLLTHASNEVQGVTNPFGADFRALIFETFRREVNETLGARDKAHVAIVDTEPEAQRLYAEFVLYQELFTSRGWSAEICDTADLRFDGALKGRSGATVDLVYNRDTDFYLQAENHRGLQEAMNAKAATISPHPHEYRLLADKERLLELSKPNAIDEAAISDEAKAVLKATLIPTLAVSEFKDAAQLWSERKKWFFKPARSFGGKATYRGSSMTKTVFQQVLAPQADYVAQEFVPAPTLRLPTADADFKYDLRFYVYRDQIQLACARFYQGQMTNSQTLGGGMAPIEFSAQRSDPGTR